MMPENSNQQTTDIINALEAIAVIADIAKRSPEIIIFAGLILFFIGLFAL